MRNNFSLLLIFSFSFFSLFTACTNTEKKPKSIVIEKADLSVSEIGKIFPLIKDTSEFSIKANKLVLDVYLLNADLVEGKMFTKNGKLIDYVVPEKRDTFIANSVINTFKFNVSPAGSYDIMLITKRNGEHSFGRIGFKSDVELSFPIEFITTTHSSDLDTIGKNWFDSDLKIEEENPFRFR